MSTPPASPTGGLRGSLRLDFPWGAAQPGAVRCVLATLVAVVASVLACALIAAITTTLAPATAGYEHFRFSDYARLTVIGVILAGIAWPLVTLLSSRARRLYLWLAIAVTVVSFAPDLWILRQGQPAAGVAALIVMHIALFAITYPTLVFGAPQPRGIKASTDTGDAARPRARS
ncbi:MAG: hypothetical protein J0I70_08320 [Microbacterium sp.]|uniref:DUF6069 family protein n=1 Tax=Microbacterium sp. TaxID=51671 RepID=UPI001AD215E9|nr:DUF6069 family protein [Microbacterium sp.]MBN9153261.1 hypothetical protein [Microbacterium sp.]MBN9171686.1 hypothetical protein [Microbacterium sp.]MBN9174144.1 hypothetical protein [Microbacterium sp.]MBN9185161.1 hypothetical protein [Microbacterium sp.]